MFDHDAVIPLAFSFGTIEDSHLDDIFFTIFVERFQIDLSVFTLESDWGSGLSRFARLRGFTQRFCLRHFLTTLKD
jgi:hypothetical protein